MCWYRYKLESYFEFLTRNLWMSIYMYIGLSSSNFSTVFLRTIQITRIRNKLVYIDLFNKFSVSYPKSHNVKKEWDVFLIASRWRPNVMTKQNPFFTSNWMSYYYHTSEYNRYALFNNSGSFVNFCLSNG